MERANRQEAFVSVAKGLQKIGDSQPWRETLKEVFFQGFTPAMRVRIKK
ncbi:MAG TPA: hypothetical protein VEL31_07890 [Ktedonobacteraceae bacterium]|nr:hypothetical protein [Ktedonobacteraceae bacterium]